MEYNIQVNNLGIGKLGETRVAQYLESKGWVILFRNYRLKIGELDIVAKTQLGLMVFVEVKASSRIYPSGFTPEDNMSNAKLMKFRRISRMFVAKHLYLFDQENGWRLDLVTITFLDDKRAILRHYKNI